MGKQARGDFAEKRLDITDLLVPHPTSTYFMRISGEAMVGIGIQDGDIVVVDRALTVSDYAIIIARLDKEFMLRRLRMKDGRTWLVTRHLQFPTAFTPDLIKQAREAVRAMYRPGYGYRKAGVYLSKIVPDESVQPDLFGGFSLDVHYKQMRLMAIVDVINKVYGRDTIFLAVQGIARPWKMRQERRSYRFTTQWGEVLEVT